jgi:hypothetical protein
MAAAAQDQNPDRPQALRDYLDDPEPQRSCLSQPLAQHGPDPLDATGKRSVHLSSALRAQREHRADAPPRRCYHRASLRQSFRSAFRSSFRRAREGLFHAPISALARSFAFVPSPFHDQTLTLGTHGTQLSPREDAQYRDHGAH